jgi:glycosyltransferase involved in cell wall biosynthesis
LEEVPEDHLPQLYNLAELYVTPSPYEGFGFPLLEAMACGTPVVYANSGSLPEIAGDAGVPVAPTSPDSLAQGRPAESGQQTSPGPRASKTHWRRTES